MAITGVYWIVASETLVRLAVPAGSWSEPWDCSADGSVIVGRVVDGSGIAAPARWDNGALTLLPAISGVSVAGACNESASVIVGMRESTSGYWSEGGAVGHVLPGNGGGETSNVARYGYFSNNRCVSTDGHTIIGISWPSGTGLKWVDGVAEVIPFDGRFTPETMSADASRIFGVNSTGRPFFVQSGSQFEMTDDVSNGMFNATDDGTLAWMSRVEFTGGNQWLYFDQIGIEYDPSFYLTFWARTHDLLPDNTVRVYNIARSGNIAIGVSSTGGVDAPLRWSGVTPTTLPILSGAHSTTPMAISFDGGIIAGTCYPIGSGERACYWDAELAIHLLPALFSGGEAWAYGVSSNGAVIYGGVTLPDTAISCAAQWTLANTTYP